MTKEIVKLLEKFEHTVFDDGKIICVRADCLEVMNELIKTGIRFDTTITDVPYGVTACKWDRIIPFKSMWERLDKLIKPNGATVLFGSEPFSSRLRLSNIKNYKYDWVWEKTAATGFLNAKKRPLVSHELIHVFYKKQCTYNYIKTKEHKPVNSYTKKADVQNKTGVYNKCNVDISGGGSTDRFPRSVQLFASDKQKNKINKFIHPTQKPVALIEYLVKTYTNENQLVLDFTAGSFTTAIACIRTKRRCIAIEIDEGYYKMGCERIKEELKQPDLFH